MTLEKKLTAVQIVGKSSMTWNPQHYNYREVNRADLDDKTLELIYKLIEKEYGKDSAQQYAQMVADIPKLSALNFLLNLYNLELNKWRWDKKSIINAGVAYAGIPKKGIYQDIIWLPPGKESNIHYNKVQTYLLRKAFLERHDIPFERIITDPFE